MRARQTNIPRCWKGLLAVVLAPAISASACGGGAGDLVELRLYPCMFGPTANMPPSSVRLTIDSFDADGAPVEKSLTETFSIDDPSAYFGDGFATVGYKKPAEVVSANFRVVWLPGMDAPDGAGAQEIDYAGLAVPDPGGSIELMSEGQCAGGGGTTTEPMTSSGTTTGDMTTTMMDMTLGTMTTGETTTGSTGVETTSSATTTGDPTTGTTGPQLDDECDGSEFYNGVDFCWTEGYGEVGTWFSCSDQTNTWTDLTDELCDCAQLGFADTVAVGCSGNGPNTPPVPFECLCRSLDPDPVFCEGGFDACMDDDQLTFCIDDYVYTTSCPLGCIVDPMDETKSICGPNVEPGS